MTLNLDPIRSQLGLVVANTPGTTVAKNTAYTLLAEVERLQGIVERVRDLHAPKVQTESVPVFDEFDSPTQTDTYCAGCGGWGSSQKLHRLCPTARALEGP